MNRIRKPAGSVSRMVISTLALVSLVVALTGCGGGGAMLADKDAEITRLNQRVTDLQKEASMLKSASEADKARAGKLEADLKKALADLESQKKLSVQGNRIVMPNAVLFSSGSIQISADGKKVLNGVAQALKEYPTNEILIEGHTDNVPIGEKLQGKYRSNWELSSARASAIVKYMQGQGMKGARLAAVGYGKHRPAASNATPAGRAQNRRAVIVVGGPMAKY